MLFFVIVFILVFGFDVRCLVCYYCCFVCIDFLSWWADYVFGLFWCAGLLLDLYVGSWSCGSFGFWFCVLYWCLSLLGGLATFMFDVGCFVLWWVGADGGFGCLDWWLLIVCACGFVVV